MSLQNESEWNKEKEYSECFFDECAMTQKLSPKQCQYAIDYFSKFISSAIAAAVSNREKEIAEEMEKKCQTGYQVASGRIEESDAPGYAMAIKDVLQIIKH